MAFRLGSEFVAGVLVGAAIGWGIDQVFGWAPWGILVFTLVGFAAGIINMMRALANWAARRGEDRQGWVQPEAVSVRRVGQPARRGFIGMRGTCRTTRRARVG